METASPVGGRNTELLLAVAHKLESLPPVATGNPDQPRGNEPEVADDEQYALYSDEGFVALDQTLRESGTGPEQLNMDLDLSADGRTGGVAAFVAALRPDELPSPEHALAGRMTLATVARRLLQVDGRTAEVLLHGPNYAGTARRWIEPAQAAEACRLAAAGARPEELWPTLDREELTAKCRMETPEMYHGAAIHNAMDILADQWPASNTMGAANRHEPHEVEEPGSEKAQAREEILDRYRDCARPNEIANDSEIAPNATVEPFVTIRPGCRIEDGARIGAGSEIGAGTIVEAGVSITNGSTIGEFCRLEAGCRIAGNIGVGVRVGKDAHIEGPTDAMVGRVEDEAVIGAGSRVCCSSASPIGAREQIAPGTTLDTKAELKPIGSRTEPGPEASGKQIHPSARVGPGCSVAPSATIGEDVRIEANVEVRAGAHVRAGADIKRGCTIGVGATVGENVQLGPGVEIESGAVIRKGAEVAREISIGARAHVAEACFVTRPVGEEGHVRAGQTAAGEEFLASRKEPDSDTPRVAQSAEVDESVHIPTGVHIGENAVVEKGVRLGAGVQIEAGAHIRAGSVIEPYARVCPGGELGERAHIGREAEIGRNERVGADARVDDRTRVANGVTAARYDRGGGTEPQGNQKQVKPPNAHEHVPARPATHRPVSDRTDQRLQR